MGSVSTALGEAIISQAIEKRKEEIRKDLIQFCCFVDPQQAKWYKAQHLRRIADVLMRVAETPNSRVILNTPPRHWKSSLASEKFPAWYLGHHPDESIILASHTATLAETFSRRVRDTIVTNDRYKVLFPNAVVRPDIMRVDDWMLTKGYRSSFLAAGVEGSINGKGGHLLIMDDPIKDYEQSNSLTYRNSLWNWYVNVFRLRIEPGTRIVIITTRWNEDDLVGRILNAEKNLGSEHFEVIEIPAEWTDENKQVHYLWPERFITKDYNEYEATKATIGNFAWRAQWLCNPSADDSSAEIQRSWFQYFPELPKGASWQVRAWDLAITSKQVDKPNPDYTATVKACTHDGVLWLGSPRLMRENWTVVQNEVKVANSNERTIRVGMGQSIVESATVQALIREGVKIEQVDERHGDHRARASVWINWARTGRVKLVGTPEEWDAFMAQWCSFPLGHDDAIDATSDVAKMLNLQFNPAPRQQSKTYDKRTDILSQLGRLR